ncbi:twitching motility protein PilT [Stenotrophomonas daejeonensis]|uniref:Ribonuclease VapC n=1 Tax=Stenotrophomonas daejeonensis TaxID=659018 RepID=A0A0R0DZH0_9GAMM|nr:type II toxin-antitoxin system VapC family toxin [Stenotrophomonas daejeonensis]KRG87581.1 twitching motility protein PilT [Stenotrophomonas daejeonensis]MCG8276024.1 type II toxin-antitoxin system VapC family toxin [Stenotrophomonas sp. NLF4-10]
MYLLDTNVISESYKALRGRADPSVAAWLADVALAHCAISSLTLMELEIGVLRMQRRDAAQGALLRAWLEQRVIPEFSGRVLAVDAGVALRCARLHVPDPASERDALLAATALVHGLTVVTRNVADFAATGVPLFNPWRRWAVQENRGRYIAAP